MPPAIVVRGARLIDGTGADPVADAVLITEGDRIAYVGPAANATGKISIATVIDADGRTLIPGLIDCHVHLCFDGVNPDFAGDAASLTPESARDRCRQAVERALDAGITTVRDLGGVYGAPVEIARAVESGAQRGARVLTAGHVITVPGGHAHFIGVQVSSVDEMVAAVRAEKEQGSHLIKLIATGGVLTPGIGAQQSAFPADQLEAAVQEAHALGMRVAAHAIGAEGIAAAVAAGVDSIEHGCFLDGVSLEGMLGNPTWLVATLSAPERISNGGPGVPDYARAKSEEVQTHHRNSFATAVEAGVRIASGTDAGTPYNFHGKLSNELRLMHESGMSLERLLPAATREPATLLGLGDTGTLEAGKRADFLLLDGDPLADVGAYERVSFVAQAGRVVGNGR